MIRAKNTEKVITCGMTAPRPEPRTPSVHNTSESQTLLYLAWLARSRFAHVNSSSCMKYYYIVAFVLCRAPTEQVQSLYSSRLGASWGMGKGGETKRRNQQISTVDAAGLLIATFSTIFPIIFPISTIVSFFFFLFLWMPPSHIFPLLFFFRLFPVLVVEK